MKDSRRPDYDGASADAAAPGTGAAGEGADGTERGTERDAARSAVRGGARGATPGGAAAGVSGALLASLSVVLGAFGAHALQDQLAPERLATFETAVRYQMFHALGLLAVTALGGGALRAAPWLLAGSLIFSGSLYLLVFTGATWWGAVAPLGGMIQIAGWSLLAYRIWQDRR